MPSWPVTPIAVHDLKGSGRGTVDLRQSPGSSSDSPGVMLERSAMILPLSKRWQAGIMDRSSLGPQA